MKRTKKVQENAPYLYLTRGNGAQKYQLFILIKTANGYGLAPDSNIETGMPLSGITPVNIRIREGIDSNGSHFDKRLQVDPTFGGLFPFNYQQDQIVVAVTIENTEGRIEEVRTSSIYYKDADPFGMHGLQGGDLALNRPYIYLEPTPGQQRAKNSNAPISFDPFLMTPLKGYSKVGDHVLQSSSANGICESFIVLSANDSRNGSVQYAYDFKVNELRYHDSSQKEGNFSVTIFIENEVNEEDSFRKKTPQEIANRLREEEATRYKLIPEHEEPARNSSEYDSGFGDEGPGGGDTGSTLAAAFLYGEREEIPPSDPMAEEDPSRETARAKTRNMSTRV